MRTITAQFAQRCKKCGGTIVIDSTILYDPETKRAYHNYCGPRVQPDLLASAEDVELADRLGFEPRTGACN